MEVIRRFFSPPPASFFLFGPRGTGKSTFVRQYFPQAVMHIQWAGRPVVIMVEADTMVVMAEGAETFQKLIPG